MKKLRKLLCGLLSAALLITAAVPASAADTKTAKDTRIIVSLGDSYSAGEGIPPFGNSKTDKKKVKDPDWLAHRSNLAWGGQLTLKGVDGTMADHRGTNWFFAAASGAETMHINGKFKKAYNYNGLQGSKSLAPQIDIFKEITPGDVDYVTLTLGGNDVGFVDIMTTALTNAKKLDQKLESVWEEYEKHIRADLKQAYKDIEKAAGKQAAIIVAAYPRLFNPDGFTALVGIAKVKVKAEVVKIVNDATDKLNAEISALVDECRKEGMNIWFAPVQDEFDGHEAYTDDPYINGVIMGSQSDDLFSGDKNVSAYSIHPNEKGAKAYAKAVQKVIDKLEAGGASTIPELKATVKSGKVTLKWNAVDGATKYQVLLYTDGKYKSVKTLTKTSLTISGLKSGTKYKYAVRAYVGGKWTKVAKPAILTIKAK